MRESNYFLHQIKHVIGAKQTAKLQLTDTTVSFPCKAAAQRQKSQLRKLLLQKAHADGTAEKLEAGTKEVTQLAVVMQEETTKIADRGDFVRARRSAGFFVYKPDESGSGLRLCSSDWAKHLPLFGHRVGRELAANRMTWMSEEGKPALCDWTRTQNKKRQTGDKELEEEEQHEAASLSLHTGFESAGPLSLCLDQDSETVQTEGSKMKLVLHESSQAGDDLLTDEAIWLELPPKVRRQRVLDALLGKTTSQKDSKRGRKAKDKAGRWKISCARAVFGFSAATNSLLSAW